MKIFIYTFILISTLISCQWWDNQIEALTCCQDGLNISAWYIDEDDDLYVCPLSCRWTKVVSNVCEKITNTEEGTYEFEYNGEEYYVYLDDCYKGEL